LKKKDELLEYEPSTMVLKKLTARTLERGEFELAGRFLVLGRERMPNPASKALAPACRLLPENWERMHGYAPVLAITTSTPISPPCGVASSSLKHPAGAIFHGRRSSKPHRSIRPSPTNSSQITASNKNTVESSQAVGTPAPRRPRTSPRVKTTVPVRTIPPRRRPTPPSVHRSFSAARTPSGRDACPQASADLPTRQNHRPRPGDPAAATTDAFVPPPVLFRRADAKR